MSLRGRTASGSDGSAGTPPRRKPGGDWHCSSRQQPYRTIAISGFFPAPSWQLLDPSHHSFLFPSRTEIEGGDKWSVKKTNSFQEKRKGRKSQVQTTRWSVHPGEESAHCDRKLREKEVKTKADVSKREKKPQQRWHLRGGQWMVSSEKGTISTSPVHVGDVMASGGQEEGCKRCCSPEISSTLSTSVCACATSALYLYFFSFFFFSFLSLTCRICPPKPPARDIPENIKTFDFDGLARGQGAFPVQGWEGKKTTQSERNSEKLPETLADYNTALMSEPRRSRPGAGGPRRREPAIINCWVALSGTTVSLPSLIFQERFCLFRDNVYWWQRGLIDGV